MVVALGPEYAEITATGNLQSCQGKINNAIGVAWSCCHSGDAAIIDASEIALIQRIFQGFPLWIGDAVAPEFPSSVKIPAQYCFTWEGILKII